MQDYLTFQITGMPQTAQLFHTHPGGTDVSLRTSPRWAFASSSQKQIQSANILADRGYELYCGIRVYQKTNFDRQDEFEQQSAGKF
jgi:hypothetical protein